MNENLQNPHDVFFKSVFSIPEVAKSFTKNYLPPEIVGELNIETLELRTESFVDEDFRERHTDLIFRVFGVFRGQIFLFYQPVFSFQAASQKPRHGISGAGR